MSHRIVQINELLKSHLGEIFTRELDLKPGVLATITKVDASYDLRHAHIFVSAFPETESRYVLQTIRHEKGKIQHELYALLSMKPMPDLSFVLDETEVRADEVEKILKEIERGA